MNDFKIKADMSSSYQVEGITAHNLSHSITSGVQHDQLNIVKNYLEEVFAGLAWFG